MLMSSGQALLDLDANNSLVPHGIGGHARSIIQGFIDYRNQAIAHTQTAEPVGLEVILVKNGKQLNYSAKIDDLDKLEDGKYKLFTHPPKQEQTVNEAYQDAINVAIASTALTCFQTVECYKMAHHIEKHLTKTMNEGGNKCIHR